MNPCCREAEICHRGTVTAALTARSFALLRMNEIKVMVISSVRPEPVSGGQLVLYRHLAGRAGIKVEILGGEPAKLTATSAIRRLVGRLGQTRLHRLSKDFWVFWQGRWLDASLPRGIIKDGQTVVLTVAHGDDCMAARRFAKKQGLPLVTFFHDWWPDIPDVHRIFRRRLDVDFRQLYFDSTAALCVSGGMKAALGDHPNAPVLSPIPAKANDQKGKTSAVRGPEVKSFTIQYFGNLFEYGPMLGQALEALNTGQRWRLEVRGPNPNWPADFKELMQRRGLWKDFAPREELDAWLADADAFLIPMVFDGRLRRRMETSFPSKLLEFAQLGKPLVVWGPEYCSAIKWARQTNRALCVTDNDPAALRAAVEKLAGSNNEQRRLAEAATEAAETEFNPEKIQAQFMEILRGIVRKN